MRQEREGGGQVRTGRAHGEGEKKQSVLNDKQETEFRQASEAEWDAW